MLRGAAVVLMVAFNWAFALQYFRLASLDWGWLFWWLFPRAIASMFIIIAGVSFTISYARAAAGKKGNAEIRKKYLLRGGKIFALGLLATVATWLFFPEGTIWFGILHLLGISIVLAPVFRMAGKWIPAVAVVFVTAGVYLQGTTITSPWLLWLGIAPENFYTFDYFPLLPWLGVFLAGIFIGDVLYRNGKRRFKISGGKILAEPFGVLGRHSLLIYVLHQPALVAFLYAAGFVAV